MATYMLGRGRLLVQSLFDPDQWDELVSSTTSPTPSYASDLITLQTSVVTGAGEVLVNRHTRRRFSALARSTRRVTTTTTRGIPSTEGPET